MNQRQVRALPRSESCRGAYTATPRSNPQKYRKRKPYQMKELTTDN